jgi:hypothetical protein
VITTIQTVELKHSTIEDKSIILHLQKENDSTYNLLSEYSYKNYRGTIVESNQLHYLSYNVKDATGIYEDRILNYINKKGFVKEK